jgi:protein tyrosine/serine phosphatase
MTAVVPSGSRVRKGVLASSGVLSFATLLVGAYLGALQLTGNFHVVVAGEVYRSAQPSAADIARYAKSYGIKTIINLRGENKGSPWYDDEVAKARELAITLVDFRMSAKHELSQEEAAHLVAVLARVEKPVLIHCKAGADRSGLASALYVAAVSKLGEAAAERQISIRYGHISLPGSEAYAMDRTFESLEPWLGYPHS